MIENGGSKMHKRDFFPGTRVLVVDGLRFKNDTETPWRALLEPATVVKWYGLIDSTCGRYEELVDVKLDRVRFSHLKGDLRHLSEGHFPQGIKLLEES